MPFTVIIHLTGTDPILGEMDSLPDTQASYVVCTNPRGRDGKNLVFVEPECTRFMFPWHRISFIEAYPSDEDRAEVETFFRE